MREIVRLGSATGQDETTLFGFVRAVEVDESGSVYVLDSGATTVRMFGSDGSHIRDIGRSGDGPGEFGSPTGMVLAPGSVLWIADRARNGYTAFGLDGTVRGSYQRGFRAAWSFEWNAVAVGEHDLVEAASIPVGSSESSSAFLNIRPDERSMRMIAVDTTPRPDPKGRQFWRVGFAESSVGSFEGGRYPIPFLPERHSVADPNGGYWTGRTDSLRFERRSEDGAVVGVVQRASVDPEPVTDTDRQRVLDEIRTEFGEVEAVDLARLPEHKPLWRSFFTDDEGRLWVERFTRTGRDSYTWEIYDVEAGFLGTVELPFSGSPTPRSREGRLVGVRRDALDVQYVVVVDFELGT